ncbi:MAG: GNAT family N-acetyltransferase [Chromatiales bacterium]|nr:GNAT family N-acetyltransferase [Chromatiales bacterium]
MNGPFALQTDRLLLEHFSFEDCGFILRLLNEPSFIENIGDKGVRDLEGARAYLRDGPIASYAANGFGLFRVGLRQSGDCIGMCGLISREILEDVDIGYGFLPEFWGQGYGIESAAAVMRYGREQLGLKRIVAVVSPGNTSSIKLLQKLGMQNSGKIRMADNEPEIDLFA